MVDYEKLGVFYLGRRFDLATGTRLDEPILYDSRDLVTHAVCVGMTGSGKTGLCLSLIEEAAIDLVPVIAIDPKGDLSNLLLTFPGLTPAEFEPWVNADEARTKGVSTAEFARQQAEAWKQGLADWGQDGERIRRLRESAEFALYTPGSTAGQPVSILRSFAAPPPAVLEDAELVGERLRTAVTGLLTLAGVTADPTRSRDHILVSAILGQAWKEGRDVDLAALVQAVQSPPISKVGVLDLESFFPAADRFELAMRLNALLASPGFDLWLQGEPLDIDRILYTEAGKPRVAVFSIAHLGDNERMFFVSLLLNQVLGWMRGQRGTSSLRALLYMDEIFGFFPPVANPPSKQPLLTLLKQARAFGLGVVLATQNPVDLDYKGLANTGTWFLGRLQTERDKARVLEGLEGASAAGGQAFDRAKMERLLAALGKRVFLLHNVHDEEPVVFQSRWAMSYLRGPLGRDEIRALSARAKGTRPVASGEAAGPAQAGPATSTAGAPRPAEPAVEAVSTAPGAASGKVSAPARAGRPVVAPSIEQYFAPSPARPAGAGAPAGPAGLTYTPMIYGAARIGFSDAKSAVDEAREVVFAAPIAEGAVPVDWLNALAFSLPPASLARDPEAEDASYEPLPSAAAKPANYAKWSKAFGQWLAQSQQLELVRAASLKMVSKAGESERDFRIRLQEALRERRDAAADQLRARMAPKLAALGERLRRAEQAVERESSQATQQKMQTAISFGATLLGAFMGRKAVSASTLGRATTAARGVGRAMKEGGDIQRAQETVETLRQQIAQLETDLQAETAALSASFDASAVPLEPVVLKPKRTQVSVQLVSLVWVADR